MSSGKFWTVFSIGVAAGAAVALLYAPQSGLRTRRQVRRSFENASDYVKNTADNITEYAGKYAGKYMKRGRDIAGNMRGTASSAYGVARKVVSI
jgi:gas vesicle protein